MGCCDISLIKRSSTKYVLFYGNFHHCYTICWNSTFLPVVTHIRTPHSPWRKYSTEVHYCLLGRQKIGLHSFTESDDTSLLFAFQTIQRHNVAKNRFRTSPEQSKSLSSPLQGQCFTIIYFVIFFWDLQF